MIEMTGPDSSEREQIQRTADMFEKILQSAPGSIENYQSLKEVYRKLDRPEKVKDVSLRLVDHYVRCNDLTAAKAELDAVLEEFPNDCLLTSKLIELGFATPAEDFSECMRDYEELCVRYEDAQVRLRIVEHDVEQKRSIVQKAKGEDYSRAEKDLGQNEEDYRRTADELATAEKEKAAGGIRLKAAIEMLPEEKRSHAEAEFVALSGEIEIVPIGEDVVAGAESPGGPDFSRLDALARQIDGEESAKSGFGEAPLLDIVDKPTEGVPLSRGVGSEAAAEEAPPEVSVGAKEEEDAMERFKELGRLFIEGGVITEKNLKEALRVVQETHKTLGVVLMELEFASDAEMANCIAVKTGLPYLPLSSYEISSKAVNLLPGAVARKYGVVPVDVISNSLLVVMANPLDVSMQKELEGHVGDMKINYYVSSPVEVDEKLNELYPS